MGASDARRVVVTSADGTALAAEVMGEGPSLLLVHGTSVDRSDWLELPGRLASAHAVWSYDRRGRGKSADAEGWDLEREIDDVRAMLAAVGEPAHLVGHSFGAVCALRAASAGVSVRSLVLYEPPIHVSRASNAVERAVAAFRAGDRDTALTTFFVDVAGAPLGEIESFRANSDAWNATTAIAHTVMREITALAQLAWNPRDYESIKVPVLHIAGGLTEGVAYATSDDISDALPHASLVTIPDQGHVAFVYDPEGFAKVVLAFTSPAAATQLDE